MCQTAVHVHFIVAGIVRFWMKLACNYLKIKIKMYVLIYSIYHYLIQLDKHVMLYFQKVFFQVMKRQHVTFSPFCNCSMPTETCCNQMYCQCGVQSHLNGLCLVGGTAFKHDGIIFVYYSSNCNVSYRGNNESVIYCHLLWPHVQGVPYTLTFSLLN